MRTNTHTHQELVLALCLAPMEAKNHSHLLPEATQVDITNTMNTQNGSTIGEHFVLLISPLGSA
jgi:hypothetical protein